jgi:fructose 5-dehydrogenase small subunit
MNHEGKSATETTAVEDVFHTDPISRRTLVKAGASAAGLAVLGVSPQPTAQAAGEVAAVVALNVDKFMAASHCLIQHRLSPGAGGRMAAILHTRIPTLDADLDAIIRTAKDKNAKVVEDFFDALPDGQVKDTAHQIIFGWYAGVVDESPTAEVFAYEEALINRRRTRWRYRHIRSMGRTTGLTSIRRFRPCRNFEPPQAGFGTALRSLA